MMKIFLLLGMFLLFSFGASSQNDTTKTTGTIVSGQIVIEKDTKVELPTAEKVYIRDSNPLVLSNPLDLQFQKATTGLPVPSEKARISPSVPRRSDLSGFNNFIKGGFGNYRSPLIHAGWYDDLNSWSVGSEIYFESFAGGPVREKNSASQVFDIALKGSRSAGDWVISPYVNYKHLGYRFYGNSALENGLFPLVADKGVSGVFDGGARIGSSSGNWKYYLQPEIRNVFSKIRGAETLNQEFYYGLSGGAKLSMASGQEAGISLKAEEGRYKGGLQYARSLISIRPWVLWNVDKFEIRTGLSLFNAAFDGESNLKVYPDVKVSYPLRQGWEVYGALFGNQELLRLDSILAENQFIDDSTTLITMEDKIGLRFGVQADLTPVLSVDAHISYSRRNGMPFIISSANDSTRFTLAYDDSAIDVVSFKGQVDYEPTSSFRTGLEVELFTFGLNSLERPWHQPSWILRPYITTAISRKVLLSASGIVMGGISAPTSVGGTVSLPAIGDFSASAKYLINERFSAFVEANNLLNNEFQRYLGYPSRGFTFKIGGQYRF